MFSKNNIGFLYIIKEANGQSGWYKVGKTTDPERRLKQYNSSYPTDKMYYTFVSEKIYNLAKAEQELLVFLREIRSLKMSKKEWFKSRNSGRAVSKIAIRKIDKIVDKFFYNDDGPEE